MPILSKIKKFFEKDEEEQKQAVIEKIAFEGLSSRINSELLNLEKEKNGLKSKLISVYDNFTNEAEEKIKVLNLINIDSKKEEEKLKKIVKDGLYSYIYCISELIVDLKMLSSLETNECFKKLLYAIQSFNRNSVKPREKATILIGKEIKETEETIKDFLLKSNLVFNEYNKLRNKSEIFKNINSQISEFSRFSNIEESLSQEIKILNGKLFKQNNKTTSANDQINLIKTTQEYAEDLKKKEKFANENQRLDYEIRIIKEKINFKELAAIYHTNNNKLEIVKKYASNFKYSLINDKELEIVQLLNEAKMGNNLDLNLFGKFQIKIREFEKGIVTESDKKLAFFESEIKASNSLNSQIKEEIDEKKKRINKLHEEKEKLKNEIKSLTQSSIRSIEITG